MAVVAVMRMAQAAAEGLEAVEEGWMHGGVL
jgi:hypothetical protein